MYLVLKYIHKDITKGNILRGGETICVGNLAKSFLTAGLWNGMCRQFLAESDGTF